MRAKTQTGGFGAEVSGTGNGGFGDPGSAWAGYGGWCSGSGQVTILAARDLPRQAAEDACHVGKGGAGEEEERRAEESRWEGGGSS